MQTQHNALLSAYEAVDEREGECLEWQLCCNAITLHHEFEPLGHISVRPIGRPTRVRAESWK